MDWGELGRKCSGSGVRGRPSNYTLISSSIAVAAATADGCICRGSISGCEYTQAYRMLFKTLFMSEALAGCVAGVTTGCMQM
jgi:hypothetical protein